MSAPTAVPAPASSGNSIALTVGSPPVSGGHAFNPAGSFNSAPTASGGSAAADAVAGARQASFQAMTQFMNSVLDPFANGREVSSLSQLAEADDGASGERNSSYVPHWSVWATGFGGSQSSNGGSMPGPGGTSSGAFGTVVGADYALSPRTIAGFALAGGGTYFSSGSGAGRSDLFQAGAFVRHMVGDAYVSAALAYGWQDVTGLAGFDPLHAVSEANAYSGRIESGYRFATPWMGLAPYAAAQLTDFRLPAYAAPSNPFSPVTGSTGVTDSRSELGFRTDKSFGLQSGALTLRGRLAWAHDFNPDRIMSTLAQTPFGTGVAFNGTAQAPDTTLATASAELRWRNNWLVSLTFQSEFSNTTRSYAGKGFVRYVW
jgi:uncharacterized protein with beta-barrel porin domain